MYADDFSDKLAQPDFVTAYVNLARGLNCLSTFRLLSCIHLYSPRVVETIIGVGAQSTLGERKIFARKICIKKLQNARILHDSCPKNYQNDRIFIIFARKNLQNSRILHDFCPNNVRILHNNCPKNFFPEF